MSSVEAAPGTRRQDDRRKSSWVTFTQGALRSRRRAVRRADDQARDHYLDWHEPRLLYLSLATLILSFTDAILTLSILRDGGFEVNILMASLLDLDTGLFAAVKMLLTGTALIFLVVHSNFCLFGIKVVCFLYAALGAYLVLIIYEIVLLWG